MQRAGRILAFVLVALPASSAAADPTPEDQAIAATLFREAKSLFEGGSVPEACAKFQESQRLAPGGGTLLNLAVCHEKEGKTATAWTEFREARVIADGVRRDDRVALVDERMKVLEPRLSKIVVRVSPGADIATLEVTVDGHEMRRATWGSAVPFDPGAHVVEARAADRTRWRRELTLGPDAAVETVEVPVLEDDRPATAPSPVTPTEPRPLRPLPRPTAVPALAVGAVGLAGLVVGSVFGIRAIVNHHDSDDACTTDPCSGESVSLNRDAKTAADVSTIAFGVGIAALAVGAYLFFVRAARPTPTARHLQF